MDKPQDPSPDATVSLKADTMPLRGERLAGEPPVIVELGDGPPTLSLPGARPAPCRRTALVWILGLALVALSLGGVWWFLYRPAQPAQVERRPSLPLPPEVAAKVKEAEQGDVHAMHALAIWYYYGINVPKDRAEGLRWYRKAVAAGSDGARQELAEIEGRK